MLLNGIRHALPTTYSFIREISSVPCINITAAIRGRKLMLQSPEINRINFDEEQSGREMVRQSSSISREQSLLSVQLRHLGRIEKIITKDASSDVDNSENENSALSEEENHRVTTSSPSQ